MSKVATKTKARVPFPHVLASALVLWSVYFAIVTIRAYLGDFEFQSEMLTRRALVTFAAIGMTLVLWAFLRLLDTKPFWMRVAAALIIAAPAAAAIAQLNYYAFSDLQEKQVENYVDDLGVNFRRDEEGNLLVDVPVEVRKDWEDGQSYTKRSESFIIAPAPTTEDMLRNFIDITLGRYFLLLAWSSLYFAMLFGAQASVAERRASEFREAAKTSELRSLRYQVNPHFLFNTLNSLSSMVMTGKAQAAEQMIQTMSRFYRHSLADDPTGDVSLDDEFDLQQLYLEIEAVRFPERLKSIFDLPSEIADARVPGMILQPLIENSVKYAVSPVSRPVTITVEAREEFDRLVITVSDDGPGVPENGRHGFGIGLANVRDRLEARFGADIAIESGPVPGGYRTEMRIPLTRNARH